MNKNNNNNIVNRFTKGLYNDTKEIDQPSGTYRYMNNGIYSDIDGNENIISSDLNYNFSDILYGEFLYYYDNNIKKDIKKDLIRYIFLGKQDLNNNNLLLFGKFFYFNKSQDIIILITNDDKKYYLNEDTELNFNENYNIKTVYKILNNGDRVVYFTDNYNEPRCINIDSFYKNNKKYALLKDIEQIPIYDLENSKVLEGGFLLSGGYNFAVQYIDNNFNKTDFIAYTHTFKVYYNNYESFPFYRNQIDDYYNYDPHYEIEGSVTKNNILTEDGITKKMITLKFTKLDESFPFYRIGIIKRTNGDGETIECFYSNIYSTKNLTFKYFGNENFEKGILEEIQRNSAFISKCASLEYLDNRMLFANINNKKNFNISELQEIASAIYIKELRNNNNYVDYNSCLNPNINIKISYTPGEIYSFGIVFILEDNTLSPAFHIPGNKIMEYKYPESVNWYTDYNGNPLNNTNVKHFKISDDIYYINEENKKFNVKNIFLRFAFINTKIDQLIKKFKLKGFYIVKNKKTFENRRIIDNVLLFPIYKLKNKGMDTNEMAYGTFATENRDYGDINIQLKQDEKIYAFYSPEFLFNNKKFFNVTHLKINSKFHYDKINFNNEIINIEDVWEYKHSERPDDDGIDLKYIYKIGKFISNGRYLINNEDDYLKIEKIKYLSPTESTEETNNIYNLCYDNDVGIIYCTENINEKYNKIIENNTYFKPTYIKHTDSIHDGNNSSNFYLCTLINNLYNNYSNFLNTPYEKEHTNPYYFNDLQYIEIFNGDFYYNSLNLINTNFLKFGLGEKPKQDDTLSILEAIGKFLIGALAVVAGIATGGVAAIAIGAAVGASFAIDGTKDAINIDKGRKYVDFINDFINNKKDYMIDSSIKDYVNKDFIEERNVDEVFKWQFALGRLVMYSNVNVLLRYKENKLLSAFFNKNMVFSNDLKIVKRYFEDKILHIDNNRKNSKKFNGFSTKESYKINKDFENLTYNPHFAIPQEYDELSDNQEVFNQRIYFSEKSLSEQNYDNFTNIKANNYIDLPGNSGAIIDLFKIKETLYVHTENGLYYIVPKMQERVTDNIVTQLGTGEFLSVPPRLLLDNINNISAGVNNNLSTLKTEHGIFFVSTKEKNIYLLQNNGQLTIINNGINKFLKNNINDNDIFITGYDILNNRIFFTNKDKWTLSYNLKINNWISFHFFIPSFYFNFKNNLFINNDENIIINKYNKDYFRKNNTCINDNRIIFILDIVFIGNPLISKIWDNFKYTNITNKFSKNITFDEIMFYNDFQCSGYKKIKILDNNNLNNTKNNDEIFISLINNEWNINDIKSYVDNKTLNFKENNITKYDNINIVNIDHNKDWKDIENIISTFLNIRLKYYYKQDFKIYFTYSLENYNNSTV